LFGPEANAVWVRLLSTSTLLSATVNNSLVGAIAMTSTLSPERTRLELAIRPDALFADGSRIVAADVVASLNHAWEVQRDGNEAWRWENVESIDLAGSVGVVITLRQPDASIPALLASPRTPILPEAWIASFAGKQDPDVPASSGTFQLRSATDRRIHFVRHEVSCPRNGAGRFDASDPGETRPPHLVVAIVADKVDPAIGRAPKLERAR
jgi:MarR-like DNA-binding transcriptional regulator SgrR of sgrS sRNA